MPFLTPSKIYVYQSTDIYYLESSFIDYAIMLKCIEFTMAFYSPLHKSFIMASISLIKSG